MASRGGGEVPSGGGGGYFGGARTEIMRLRRVFTMPPVVLFSSSESGVRVERMLGLSVGSCLRERRTERKSGRARFRFAVRAWWIARAVVAVRMLEEMGLAVGRILPVCMSMREEGFGLEEVAMSRAHLYIASAAWGVPL